MIIETIVSTRSKSGNINFAPMGIEFPCEGRVTLTPYHSSVTYQNLIASRSGVANLLSDVELFVKCALLDHTPDHSISERVAGGVMESADEVVEFSIDTIEDKGEKSVMSGDVISRATIKAPGAGIARGSGAVIEALIAVTRIGLLPDDEIEATVRRSRMIVDKTGGPIEFAAMSLVERYYENR